MTRTVRADGSGSEFRGSGCAIDIDLGDADAVSYTHLTLPTSDLV